jgi:FAD/FMN-containing dehydrogenase
VSLRRSRIKRREFLKGITATPFAAAAARLPAPRLPEGELVNDVHTGLNPTWVSKIVRPASAAEVESLVRDCHKRGVALAISGSRHAAGGQQFAANALLLDMRAMNRLVHLGADTGILHVEAGIEWPELIHGYLDLQQGEPLWGIRQKQGGADRMTLGGTISANAHGHSLGAGPVVGDLEWIEIVTADGTTKRCTRKENKELLALAVGGYGLFGVITAAGLRLVPRRKVRRRVETRTTAELAALIAKRTSAGDPYGYFQYSIDETSPDFLRTGILTTYEPVKPETPLTPDASDIDARLLTALLELAHKDRGSAYRRYAKIELAKDGAVEWSDLHQLSTYVPGYHADIEKRLDSGSDGADLIVEVYVPPRDLIPFLEDARRILLTDGLPLVYGVIRFVEQDKETFLAWAKKRYACVIFTPHTSGEARALHKAGETCRQLMRAAIRRGGSFYLTYNRFATRDELSRAYPQFAQFLVMKRQYDPLDTLQSEWYRHYKGLYP